MGYIPVDYSEIVIEKCKERLKGQFKTSDVHNLSYPDNFFDRVTCTETLEHVDDFDMVMSEMWRILKPEGEILITVPDKDLDTPPEKWPGGIRLHVNNFSKELLVQHVNKIPFQVSLEGHCKRKLRLVAKKNTVVDG